MYSSYSWVLSWLEHPKQVTPKASAPKVTSGISSCSTGTTNPEEGWHPENYRKQQKIPGAMIRLLKWFLSLANSCLPQAKRAAYSKSADSQGIQSLWLLTLKELTANLWFLCESSNLKLISNIIDAYIREPSPLQCPEKEHGQWQQYKWAQEITDFYLTCWQFYAGWWH